MSTALLPASHPRGSLPAPSPLPFRAGDRLDQPTFHRLSARLPEHLSAELVEGVVLMAPSVTEDHGGIHSRATTAAGVYGMRTPGVEIADNASVILGPNSELQPDVILRLTPECGGQTVVVNHHLTGAPELVVEVSVGTETTDLGGKKRDYQRAGVQEYVVVLVRHRQAVWFENLDGEFVERAPDPDGVYRSRRFPGFWLDPLALLERDGPRLLAVLQQGLDSPEHAAFVAELAVRRAASTTPAGP